MKRMKHTHSQARTHTHTHGIFTDFVCSIIKNTAQNIKAIELNRNYRALESK